MKTTIQIALVVAATAFALNAMSQTAAQAHEAIRTGQPWPSDWDEPVRGLLHVSSDGIPNLSTEEYSKRSFTYLVEEERFNSRKFGYLAAIGAGLAMNMSSNMETRTAGGWLAVAASTTLSVDGISTFFKKRKILKGNL